MKLSVIIPTRDRADFLSTALKSLEQQTIAPEQFEVLVVDNGSTDHTKDVAADARAQLQNLRYLLEPEPGLHAGRHRGMSEASGDVLVYADDDIRALPEWLATIADIFSDPVVAMAGGNNYPDFLGAVPPWLEKLWAKPTQNGRMLGPLSILSLQDGRRNISPLCVWGCNFSIRKQVLLDAGGFHPDAMPKELLHLRGDGETHVSQYVQNKGLTCIFDSDASVFHAVTADRMTFEYFRQRAFNQGVSDSYTALRARNARSRWLVRSSLRLRRGLSGLRRLISPRPKDAELRQLGDVTQAGYVAGYDWHQQRYWEDPDVKAWVHRDNYFA